MKTHTPWFAFQIGATVALATVGCHTSNGSPSATGSSSGSGAGGASASAGAGGATGGSGGSSGSGGGAVVCTPAAGQIVNSLGQLGRTEYDECFTVGFQSLFGGGGSQPTIWGASHGLFVTNVFWDKGTFYTDPTNAQTIAPLSAAAVAAGVVPSLVAAQMWEDIYLASKAPLPGEPSFVASDRANGGGTPLPMLGEFQAYASFVDAHPSMAPVALNGGTLPTDWQAGQTGMGQTMGWAGQVGWFGFPTRGITDAECAAVGYGTGCTWGDYVAGKLGQTVKMTQIQAVMGSDGTNDSWWDAAQGDFNQDILAQFQAWAGVKLPFDPAASGVTLSPSQLQADAEYILDGSLPGSPPPSSYNHLGLFTKWIDWWGMAMAQYDNAIVTNIVKNLTTAVKKAVFFPGGGGGIAAQRRQGVDGKAIAAVPGLADQAAISVDSITIESDRDCSSPLSGWYGAVSLAARAPGVRAGDILNAAGGLSSDTNGVNAGGASGHSKCYPTLQGTAWTAWEKGAFDAQLLDRAWAYILDTGTGTPTAGRVRRALAFLSMDHFDSGSFSDNVKALAAKEVPTKPFGCAVYYSEAANRQSEMFSVPNGPFSPQVGDWAIDPYLAVEQVEAVRTVIPVGYYFTDDALAALAQAGGKSPYAPACLIAQNSGYTGTNAGALAYFGMQLSATEKANAAKLGIPIYDDAAATGQTHSAGAVAAAALGAKLPLQLPAGMRGSAFVDQHDRIVILVSPMDLSATAATASGTVHLNTLADGAYTVTPSASQDDWAAGASIAMNVSAGSGSFPVSLPPWQAAVFVVARN